MVFIALKYGEEEVGKKLTHTKRRYIWVFMVDDQKHKLELFCSFISGKKLVLLDSIPIHQSKNFGINFEFKHSIKYHNFRITQNVSAFPLYVDNTEFITIMREERRKRKQQKQQQIFYVNESVPFHEFQEKHIYQQKQISNIEPGDFQFFNSKNKKQQIVDIQIQPITMQPEYHQSQLPNIMKEQVSYSNKQIDQKQKAQNNIFSKGFFKNIYIPSPAQIIKEKKNQIAKLMNL